MYIYILCNISYQWKRELYYFVKLLCQYVVLNSCSIVDLKTFFSVFGHLLIPHLTYENKENSHVNILRKITK